MRVISQYFSFKKTHILDEMDFEFIMNTIQNLDESEQQDGLSVLQGSENSCVIIQLNSYSFTKNRLLGRKS